MTQFTIKNTIDNSKIDIILNLLQSWDVEVEVDVKDEESATSAQHKLFSKTFGMWKNYEIDAKELRRKAWGTDKLLQQ
jgi:hypothetical protein